MRSLLAGTPRSPLRPEALPGLVGKRRSLVASLAIALTLSLCGTALAAPMPTSVDSNAFSLQSGPIAERTSSEAPAAALSPRADAAPALPSDDGLGALVIVLISAGGAVALAAAAYTATRFVHHPHPVG
jgi:hypothetical protein